MQINIYAQKVFVILKITKMMIISEHLMLKIMHFGLIRCFHVDV